MKQDWYDKSARESARKYWDLVVFGFKKEAWIRSMAKCKLREHYRSIL